MAWFGDGLLMNNLMENWHVQGFLATLERQGTSGHLRFNRKSTLHCNVHTPVKAVGISLSDAQQFIRTRCAVVQCSSAVEVVPSVLQP